MDREGKRGALLSVSDQRGIVEFAAGLAELGFQIIATDGTAQKLENGGLSPQRVSEVTQFPEILGGRVKTLHPAIYGGILARRTNGADVAVLSEHGIGLIDVVVVNLYPFLETMMGGGGESEIIENIDIGGPALLRAAAKNWDDVVVVTDPDDYEDVLGELIRYQDVKDKTKRRLAAKAFSLTAAYDANIASWMALTQGDEFPSRLSIPVHKVQDLRYGENLHQKAALYSDRDSRTDSTSTPTVADARQLHGKELSFNNYLDLDSAWSTVQDFTAPAASIIKHTNPTGLAAGQTLLDAYNKAYSGDPVAAYGGIVGLNRVVDADTATALVSVYFEAVIAPGFSAEALGILAKKKAIRLVTMDIDQEAIPQNIVGFPYRDLDYKKINGGFLLQTRNTAVDPTGSMEVVSQREPTLEELTDLIFAWRAVKHVKSNAIVLAKQLALVGVGAGQMSRVNSVDLACRMAEGRAQGSVLGSDAYFPFADGVERAADAGVSAIIQPGGSIRDKDAIEAANRAGMAMIFTGIRHFKH